MSSQIDIVIKEVEKFNDSIKQALNSKKISNTGEAARSLRVEFGNDFVQSIGIFYLEFLDTGRGNGKFPPAAPIQKWVETKLGISPDSSEFDGVVYLIRRKIARLGTEIFRNNSKGIELTEKIVSLKKEINKNVKESVFIGIKQRLDRFKKIHLKNKYQL